MTVSLIPRGASGGGGLRRRLTSREDLIDALGIPFSEQQLDAITAPREPAVIIAGAGSGKTTVMAARVVWLVGTGAVRPEEVLGLTFTRKAASELSARVRAALTKAGIMAEDGVDEAGEQVVMTYDAFASRLVSEHGLRIGVDAEQTMITGATRYRLAARVVANAAGPFSSISRLRPATLVERVLKLDADLTAHLVPTDALDAHAREYARAWASAPEYRGRPYKAVREAEAALAERLELATLVVEYQRLKQRLGVVEFADQMAVAAQLTKTVPEVATLVRDQFRVVLLDEYQDTSAAQAAVLQALFSTEGRGHPVTAVGDPFQAIYGWRGAAASNILNFSTDFPKADKSPAEAYSLTLNRRSGQTILDVANVISAPLRADVTLTGEDEARDTRLFAPKDTPPGAVRSAHFESWPEELAWIGDQIVAAKESGAVSSWSDIAVLTRRNAHISSVYSELVARDVPVEIVGLGGLLGLPEIRDVVGTLRILDDVTANPDVARLLSGPRWNLGPRDLALLGRRAKELAKSSAPVPAGGDPLVAELEGAVASVDPVELVSLVDAVESPGDLPFSDEARSRLARFAAELTDLRAHSAEPVLDIIRRVVATLGLEVELVATPHFQRIGRRNQLGAFLDAVADYVDVDGDASLAGLLAYLQAEMDQGNGLDQAVPSDSDSVKLLTMHRAKGLEWPVVFLPALVEGVFPSDRVTDNWIKNSAAIPAELRGDHASIPQLEDATNDGLKQYAAALKEGQRQAEDRLGYVAVTRAKQVLVGSAHTWDPDTIRPKKLSGYFEAIAEEATRQAQVAASTPAPEPGAVNPLQKDHLPVPWPRPLDPDARERRQEAALSVAAARQRFAESGVYELADPGGADSSQTLFLDEAEQVASWDEDLDRLITEARELRLGRRRAQLPVTLSTSALLNAARDPAAYAEALIRPMPSRPSPSARLGTQFHAWVEQRYAPGGAHVPLIDLDDLTDAADSEVEAESGAELRELCQRFVKGQFGELMPHALEAPFTLLLDGQPIRGRIDAIYRSSSPEFDWQVVDWKSGHDASQLDPGQLAIYRRAWADLQGVPPERVDAVFYLIRTDKIFRPASLPDPEDLLARTR